MSATIVNECRNKEKRKEYYEKNENSKKILWKKRKKKNKSMNEIFVEIFLKERKWEIKYWRHLYRNPSDDKTEKLRKYGKD